MGIEVKRVGVRRTNCSCSMPGVWRALSFVRGALVIFHSPRPCAHIAHGMDVSSFHRLTAAGTSVRLSPVPLLTSGLSENEAVFGGEERLRECIRFAAQKYHPQAVFIANSCVSGVIGDDTQAIAAEMEEELGLPVTAVSAHGFLDGEYYAGYLDAARALVDRFMQPAERKEGTVVLLGDCGGMHGEYVKELRRLLSLLGLRVTGQFPSYLALDELQAVPEAELVILLGRRMDDEKQAQLAALAAHIRERLGTPYLADVYAVGAEETARWLRCVGQLCHCEEAAERAIVAEEASFAAAVEKARNDLAGRRCALAIGRDLTWFQPEIVLRLLDKAGIELIGIVLLDCFMPERRAVMEEELRRTDVPIHHEGDAAAEELLHRVDFVLTTHELVDTKLRQLFLALLPSVGWSMERRLLDDMRRILHRHESRGGLIYG